MAKKLLFLEDLYEFYINKKEDIRFSSIENDNSPIVVQTHGNLNFEKKYCIGWTNACCIASMPYSKEY